MVKSTVAVCAGILLYAISDQAIFGSGWYLRFLDPDSLAGRVVLTVNEEAGRPGATGAEVAVVGNSMLAEGFSAKVADSAAAGRMRFRNLSVPASTPRCWYYLLRAADEEARRYRAIVIQVEEYSDEDGETPMADAISDVHIVDPLLKPSDALDFALSFSRPRLQFEALRGTLLKGYIYKQDVQALLEAPSRRLEKMAQARQGYAGWIYDYPGREQSLAGMKVDWARRSIDFPPGVPADIRDRLRRTILRTRARQTGEQARYRRLWFGRILERYSGGKTRIIFVRVPRGPAVNPAFDDAGDPSTIRAFATRPYVTLMDPHAFQSLEQPEYFFDDLHMNHAGRERFSRMLARALETEIGKDR